MQFRLRETDNLNSTNLQIVFLQETGFEIRRFAPDLATLAAWQPGFVSPLSEIR